jgi:predicted Zn-dependent protease
MGDPQGKAKQAFLAAIDRDATNARAWAGLSSVWSSEATQIQAKLEEAIEQAERAANTALALDSLEGSAWLTLAVATAFRTRSVHAAEPWFAKAIEVDPSNPEIQAVKAAMYRHAWAWNEARDAARMARRLDQGNLALIDREATIGLCSNNPAESLDLYRLKLRLAPDDAWGHRGAARALARLGKWNDAVAELRTAWPPKTASDSALRDTLARGEDGYWQLTRADGRQRLDAALTRRGNGEWVAPMRLAFLQVAAGEIDAGLDELAKAAPRGDLAVYRTPCQADWDEARKFPRFWQILESAPKWDLGRPVPR